MTDSHYSIRKLLVQDKPAIVEIVKQTGVFSDEEVQVAIELMDEFLHKPDQRDYDIYVAEGDGGELLGYYCVGPTPLTRGTFDLYWIAVNPRLHNRGIGGLLNRHCEDLVRSQGGRLIVAETSSMPHYDGTRRFYLRQGYQEVARIHNYYKVGDDLVVYGKYVQQ